MAKLDHTPEQLLHETLKIKLTRGEEVTWGDVVIALYGAGEDDLAQQVARTHTPQRGSIISSYPLIEICTALCFQIKFIA